MAELIERVVMVRLPVIPDLFIAEKVWSGALVFHSLSELSDAEVIQRLTALDGVGV